MAGTRAFWSYVHQDDDDDAGRIVELSRLLSSRLRLLTGSPFQIFLDRDELGWGDDWESRIDETLLTTTFFIPIVTPSYFRSSSCRGELLRFASAAGALGLEELILPIYYANVDELTAVEPSGDELIELVRKFQWEDWRDLALEDVSSSLHRKGVNRLAARLLDRAKLADSKPAPDLTEMSRTEQTKISVDRAANEESPAENSDEGDGAGGPDQEDAGGEDDEPGLMDILAAGEAALTRFNESVNQIPPILDQMGESASAATEELHRSDAQGKGFAGRLVVGRRLARQLEAPAETLEAIVTPYLEDLLLIDPMVRTILALLKEDPDQIAEATAFLDSMEELARSGEGSLGSLEEMATAVRNNASWSKDLRKPSTRIEKALRQLVDSRTLFGQWLSQIHELRQLAGSQGRDEETP